MSIKSLSELRKAKGGFDSLMKEVDRMAAPSKNQDDGKYWQPAVDKAGNGYAVIRFLPAPQGEDLPWVQMWSHGFQGPTGKWYIENSLTTLGKQDPVAEYNSTLWNSGLESDKEIARKQKRRLNYISNILVIKDPANPENEGKVFLFKYGKKIFDKIKDLMKPEFEDEQPINPFDFWEGANFKLKIRKVEGYRNYDKSEFDTVSALFDDDDQIEQIWKQEHSLKAFLDPKEFKDYETLKKRLEFVLGLDSKPSTRDLDDEPDQVAPRKMPEMEAAETKAVDTDLDDDDSLSYFESLAKED